MYTDDCVSPDSAAEIDQFPPLTVVLTGTVDADAIAAWCAQVRALSTAGHRTIRCDVRGLSDCAAAILHVLTRIQLTAKRSGGEVLLLGANDTLRTVLELAGMTEVLPLAKDQPPH